MKWSPSLVTCFNGMVYLYDVWLTTMIAGHAQLKLEWETWNGPFSDCVVTIAQYHSLFVSRPWWLLLHKVDQLHQTKCIVHLWYVRRSIMCWFTAIFVASESISNFTDVGFHSLPVGARHLPHPSVERWPSFTSGFLQWNLARQWNHNTLHRREWESSRRWLPGGSN